jgi:putative transposase
MKPPPDPHYRHRFPVETISYAVWLYHLFSLSLGDVELLLAERGVVVSYETVRRWCKKFGASFADRLRRRRPRPRDKWTKSSSGSSACSNTSGAPSIRMVLCSTSWFRRGGMATPQALLQATSEGFAIHPAGLWSCWRAPCPPQTVLKPSKPLGCLGSEVLPCPSTGRGPAWCGASRCRRATMCSATICLPTSVHPRRAP